MTYTVEQIALRCGLPLRTARYRVGVWQARGWPLVTREPCRGDSRGRLLVDAAEFEALLRGELSQEPAAA